MSTCIIYQVYTEEGNLLFTIPSPLCCQPLPLPTTVTLRYGGSCTPGGRVGGIHEECSYVWRWLRVRALCCNSGASGGRSSVLRHPLAYVDTALVEKVNCKRSRSNSKLKSDRTHCTSRQTQPKEYLSLYPPTQDPQMDSRNIEQDKPDTELIVHSSLTGHFLLIN